MNFFRMDAAVFTNTNIHRHKYSSPQYLKYHQHLTMNVKAIHCAPAAVNSRVYSPVSGCGYLVVALQDRRRQYGEVMYHHQQEVVVDRCRPHKRHLPELPHRPQHRQEIHLEAMHHCH